MFRVHTAPHGFLGQCLCFDQHAGQVSCNVSEIAWFPNSQPQQLTLSLQLLCHNNTGCRVFRVHTAPHGFPTQCLCYRQPDTIPFFIFEMPWLLLLCCIFLAYTWPLMSFNFNVCIAGDSVASLKQSVTFVWILTQTNIRIYSYQENDTNEYTNIFVWNFLTWTNIRIYSYQNFDTNEYSNKYLDQKYSTIQLYSPLSGLDWHQFCAFTI